jgi:hypothetical protein
VEGKSEKKERKRHLLDKSGFELVVDESTALALASGQGIGIDEKHSSTARVNTFSLENRGTRKRKERLTSDR